MGENKHEYLSLVHRLKKYILNPSISEEKILSIMIEEFEKDIARRPFRLPIPEEIMHGLQKGSIIYEKNKSFEKTRDRL